MVPNKLGSMRVLIAVLMPVVLIFLGLSSLFDLSAFLPSSDSEDSEGRWIWIALGVITVGGGWVWWSDWKK